MSKEARKPPTHFQEIAGILILIAPFLLIGFLVWPHTSNETKPQVEQVKIVLDGDQWTCTKQHFQPIGMAVSWPCDQYTIKGVQP